MVTKKKKKTHTHTHIPIKIMQTYNGILHAMNEMPLTMSHVLSPHRLHQTQVPTDFYHTMHKPMRDKIHHSWITSDDHFTKQISFFFKPKAFWMLHLNDHLYSKSCVFLWVENFRGLIPGIVTLSTLSQAFTVGHICITKTNADFTEGVSISTC